MTKVTTFTELCDLMNYDSQYTRTTGIPGDIVPIQEAYLQVIANCDLTLEQRKDLETFVIGDNGTLGKESKKNTANVEMFNSVIKTSEQSTKIMTT